MVDADGEVTTKPQPPNSPCPKPNGTAACGLARGFVRPDESLQIHEVRGTLRELHKEMPDRIQSVSVKDNVKKRSCLA